jgi:hypothetical protein
MGSSARRTGCNAGSGIGLARVGGMSCEVGRLPRSGFERDGPDSCPMGSQRKGRPAKSEATTSQEQGDLTNRDQSPRQSGALQTMHEPGTKFEEITADTLPGPHFVRT